MQKIALLGLALQGTWAGAQGAGDLGSTGAVREDGDFLDMDAIETELGVLYMDRDQDGPPPAEEAAGAGDPPPAVETAGTDGPSGAPPEVFDAGPEERRLLELARGLQGRISHDEWNEIAASAETGRYTVQRGDWLWKIARRLFGSGFYYSKIWSLNPQITNPHEIEPGMVLLFSTGDPDEMPNVAVGGFGANPMETAGGGGGTRYFDLAEFGDDVRSDWLAERERLIAEGAHFEFATPHTYAGLADAVKGSLVEEYKKYNPVVPPSLAVPDGPSQELPSSFANLVPAAGDFKRGFFLNTFVTDEGFSRLGTVESFRNETTHVQVNDSVYVRFDPAVAVAAGDMFSAYRREGVVRHERSDREGERHTVTGHLRAVRPVEELWECVVEDLAGLVARGAPVTVYVPKIEKIIRTWSRRPIEAAIIGSYHRSTMVSQGDVVYLDRGRIDGVDVGTVFSVQDFVDRGTGKRISRGPAYRTGELSVISLSDNFSTAMVHESTDEIRVGHLAFSQSEEEALRLAGGRRAAPAPRIRRDGLDVELNVGSLSDDILKAAGGVRLSGDEVEELERQERERSMMTEHDRDLLELERLEKEVGAAEAALDEARLDEDRYLEELDLDALERADPKDPDAFKDLDEIEGDIGRKYMDQALNAEENPYGLTPFDIEETRELLNEGGDGEGNGN